MTATERDRAAADIIDAARSVFTRGLTHGSTGNISVRTADGILVTPTGSSLGTVQASDLSLIDDRGGHLSGPKPSKEAFLHAAVLRARPGARAVVHTHSTYSAAVSCIRDLDTDNVLPPLTAYYAMRVGRLPLLPYYAPGDTRLEALAEATAARRHAMLLSNHGPVVAGASLAAALDALEELEETAKLAIILRGLPVNPLTAEQAAALDPQA
ncbi:3-oxo-tetronate 4-phosphate decarboxylase [Streptomyces canus]|uniref:3-oxo-tetronate 4-phosphate decarboxylase n=1 Tax=Streptomyces canus TaxID=58343 RepID=UPI000369A65A|nr:3-oxo-tetronate 4-phosphate decarboxylase [Streptomyces canus]